MQYQLSKGVCALVVTLQPHIDYHRVPESQLNKSFRKVMQTSSNMAAHHYPIRVASPLKEIGKKSYRPDNNHYNHFQLAISS